MVAETAEADLQDDMFIACEKGDLEMLKDVLLDAEVFPYINLYLIQPHLQPQFEPQSASTAFDLNSADEDGYTPLMTAAHYGHHPIVALLLQHKARIRLWVGMGGSLLFLSCSGQHPRLNTLPNMKCRVHHAHPHCNPNHVVIQYNCKSKTELDILTRPVL